MRVYRTIGKIKWPSLGVRNGRIKTWNFARAPLKTSQKPIYSAKMVAFFFKEKCTESPLKAGGFSVYGESARVSPVGTVLLAPAPAGDW